MLESRVAPSGAVRCTWTFVTSIPIAASEANAREADGVRLGASPSFRLPTGASDEVGESAQAIAVNALAARTRRRVKRLMGTGRKGNVAATSQATIGCFAGIA